MGSRDRRKQEIGRSLILASPKPALAADRVLQATQIERIPGLKTGADLPPQFVNENSLGAWIRVTLNRRARLNPSP